MSETHTPMEQNWNEFVEQMNEQFVDALEQNLEAQAEFVESWSEAVEQSVDDETVGSGVQGYAKAYQSWMQAAQQMVDRANDSLEGEAVDPDEFRDIWLNTANEAFKDVMNTTAFARMTGEAVGDALEAQRQADETAENTLHSLGFATEGDIQEVGDRIVEMERRQHEVERKLDRVLDALEE